MMQSSLTEIAEVVGGQIIGNAEALPPIRRVVIDSRKVGPGDLFLAFPGEKTDGHLFVGEAFRKGALASVVSRTLTEPQVGPVIPVENVEQALIRLATWFRKKIKVPVIAVTGSSGKSTTKEITAHLLSQRFRVLASPESYNNEIGVPLSLLSFEPSHQVVVLEMAMRGKGQIRRLCDIAAPTLGLITSIGEAHVGLLGSVGAIADAKGELLESLPQDGAAFLNGEDSWTPYLKKKTKCPVRTYGFGLDDPVRAENVRETWNGIEFKLNAPSGRIEILFPLIGRHNLLDLLGACAIAVELGVPLAGIKAGARTYKTLHGRLEKRIGQNGILILDDSYNANPSSLLAAIKTAQALPVEGRRILAMGDMLELGEFGEEAHRKMGDEIFEHGLDAVFGLGELTAYTVEQSQKRGLKVAKHFPDHESLISELEKFAKSGDLVLAKGSRRMTMEKVVERLVEK